jgi:hypothetical protein
VDVVIDKWDLKAGHDKFKFMESMVKSSEIKKVLMILDQQYSKKADDRAGGVGTETTIISPKIYANASQEKFIPIVSETDENGEPFVPTFLEGRMFINLSSEESFEENYEKLLRDIYGKPAYAKPKIGTAPSYLFDESPMKHKTSSILRSFENQASKYPNRINSVLRDFLNEFFLNLQEYKIDFPSLPSETEAGKIICDNINSYTPLRNELIQFFDKLLKSEIKFDIEIVIRFLERLPLLTSPQDGRNKWSADEFANFRFFIHELFLYLIAVGVKNEKYEYVENLLLSSYFFREIDNTEPGPKTFGQFHNIIEIINQYYNETYSKQFFSPMADLMIKRIPENFMKDNLVEADLLCHYVGVLNHIYWFPITYVYRSGRKI